MKKLVQAEDQLAERSAISLQSGHIEINPRVLDNSRKLITIHRLSDFGYEYANPAILQVIGYSREELLSNSPFDLIHPDDLPRIMARVRRELARGTEKGKDEYRFRRKNGSYIWLETSGTIMRTEQGSDFILMTNRDVTKRKLAEEALRQAYEGLESKVQAVSDELDLLNHDLELSLEDHISISRALQKTERYYQTIFENTGTATIIVDKNMKIMAANLKSESLTGYSRDELIGHDALEKFVTPEYAPICRENYRRRQHDPDSAPAEYEICGRHKNGAIKNVILNVAKVPGGEELVVSLRDITAQHQAEQALKASEKRFRTIFETAPIAIGIYRDGQHIKCNQTFANLAGFKSPADMTGTPAINQVAPQNREEILTQIRGWDAAGELPRAYDVLGVRQDGSSLDISAIVGSILLPDGPARVGYYMDVTERKKAEAGLARQLGAQNMLLEVSRNFSNVNSYNIDAMINLTLKMIGEFDQSDRAYIVSFSEDGTTMCNTHEWCAAHISSATEQVREVSPSSLPWLLEKLQTQPYLHITQVDKLLPEAHAERECLLAQSVKSLLVVPMFIEEKLIAYIGFDAVKCEKAWSDEDIIILESVAQTIAKALRRKRYVQALQDSENYYRTIFENTGAATFIIEADMTISSMNDELLTLLNMTREEVTGVKFGRFVPEDYWEQMERYHHLRRISPDMAPRKYPIKVFDKQGRIKEGLLTIDMIPGTKASAATFVDLTDFRRIDRALKAIGAVNMAITRAEKEEELMDTVCRCIVEIGGYSLAWGCFVPNDREQKVKPLAYAGRDNGFINKLNVYLNDPRRGAGPTGRAIKTGEPVISRNFKNDPHFKPWLKDALRRGFKSVMSIPFKDDENVFGALCIYCDEIDCFDREEQKLLTDMANNLAYAFTAMRAREERDKAALELGLSLEKLQHTLMQAVTSLGTALDMKDPSTAGHQRRVACLASAVAREMGLANSQIEGIAVTGNLHDIGKIDIPSEILGKPRKLTELEYSIIKNHCQAGHEITKQIDFPWPVAEVILQHHERMDGSGYPRGLAGEEILLEARILAVADVVEAMLAHRPHRPALGIDAALEEISGNSGTLYDPDVVAACVALFREKGYRLE